MATTLPTGGMIDPTKQAEYPVLLGDRLAGNNNDPGSQSRLINLNYNYKTKSTSAQQRSTLARSSQSRDLYNLTITDKPPNAENTLTYLYEGSVDPAAREAGDAGEQTQEYALVFDAERKAYILEPVTAQLNFNLRSAPAKTEKQVTEQYEQLRTLQLEDQPVSGDDQVPDGIVEEDDGPADDSNPYDFRHFLPKEGEDNDKSDVEIVDTHKPSTPAPAAKPAPKPKPRPKTQTDPMRQKKTEPKKSEPKKTEPKKTEPKKKQPPPAEPAKPEPYVEEKEDEPEPAPEPAPEPEAEPRSSPSDTGMAALSSHKAAPSPGSNIIIDGDLIIDMGSPPPTRRTFNINPAHFSSNNTPNGEENETGRDDEMMDNFRLPSPVDNEGHGEHEGITPGAGQEDEVEDDDALAAEMEAAFEESAREEDPVSTQSYQQRQYNAPSDDESEVSEEE